MILVAYNIEILTGLNEGDLIRFSILQTIVGVIGGCPNKPSGNLINRFVFNNLGVVGIDANVTKP
jgi:hypothetical protein